MSKKSLVRDPGELKKEAKQTVKDLAYKYLYVDLLKDPTAAVVALCEEHSATMIVAGFYKEDGGELQPYITPATVKKQATLVYDTLLRQERSTVTRDLFVQQLNMRLKVQNKVYRAIMEENQYTRITQFVQASKSVDDILPGMLAPQRHAIAQDMGDVVVTEKERVQAREAAEFTDEYEKQLLGGDADDAE